MARKHISAHVEYSHMAMHTANMCPMSIQAFPFEVDITVSTMICGKSYKLRTRFLFVVFCFSYIPKYCQDIIWTDSGIDYERICKPLGADG